MRTAEFDYALPEALIAQRPAHERTASRLLDLTGDEAHDRTFADLPRLLSPGDLLVVNDTRVVRARLCGRKPTGGVVEVLVERPLDGNRLLAQVRASKPVREGTEIRFGEVARATVRARRGELLELALADGPGLAGLMEMHGEVPLPPYVRRAAGPLDAERYQTVYARRDGAVAAPTAGLHFDETLLATLRAGGVEIASLTLHVGAGTFRPVRAERVEDHAMHAERVEVPDRLCAAVAGARERGGRVVAVGTTCVRAIEAAAAGGDLVPFAGETTLFIRPGFRFRVVDLLVTNFHLPRSTLLMLVCALGGTERVLGAYRHAVDAGYRFYSYGDAMLVGPLPG